MATATDSLLAEWVALVRDAAGVLVTAARDGEGSREHCEAEREGLLHGLPPECAEPSTEPVSSGQEPGVAQLTIAVGPRSGPNIMRRVLPALAPLDLP